MDCSPPGSSVHGILQTRILEWVALPFSKGSPQPRSPASQAGPLRSEPPEISLKYLLIWLSQEPGPCQLHHHAASAWLPDPTAKPIFFFVLELATPDTNILSIGLLPNSMWATQTFRFLNEIQIQQWFPNSGSPQLLLLFFKDFLREVLGSFTTKLRERYSYFPYALCPHTCIVTPLPIPSSREVHLLQLMDLHWYIIITRSSQFISGLTLGVVHSMGLDKCIHHYSITQNIFTALGIFSAMLILFLLQL